MAGRIPQTFIHELLTRLDLIEVIDNRVTLKKSGKNYSACCPFHNEKSPSFSVSPDKQFYHCFGCGVSGNAITFIMEYEGLDFVSAIEELASQIALEVPREAQSSMQPQYTDLFSVMEKVSQFYQQQLKTNPAAEKAVKYLKNRGVSGEIAKQYGIGYAPNEWKNLSHISGDQNQLKKDLIDTGMSIEKENGKVYDRFRDRVMFPIRNRRGQVLGFGGRIIDQGEPKYLNSPETKLFHKSKELYGLFEMRRQLRQIDSILVVEGYMDVVALAQFGIANSVATLGTATTSEHLQSLFRICPKIIFCFDGDKAGRAAALRAVDHAIPQLKDAREIRLMFLPDGEDPDSLVRNIGAEAFNLEIENAMTLFDYLMKYLTKQVDMNTFEGPAKLVHLAKTYLKLITDPVLLARFEQRLCELSGLNQKQLQQTFSQDKSKAKESLSKQNANLSKTRTQQSGNSPFRRIIALLLQYPNQLPVLDFNWLSDSQEIGGKILLKLCQQISDSPNITTAILLENWRGEAEENHLLKLANVELHSQPENVAAEISEILIRIKKDQLMQQWDKLIEKSKQNQPLTESEKNTLKTLQKSLSESKY